MTNHMTSHMTNHMTSHTLPYPVHLPCSALLALVQLVDASLKAGYNYICQPMSYSTDVNHVRVRVGVRVSRSESGSGCGG